MPKVNADLASVSTKFTPIEPGNFRFKVEDIEDRTQGNRPAYMVISQQNEPGTDDFGKKVFDYCSLTKKDGSPNNAGLAQFKRYFEAVCGVDTVADPNFEYDTDLLKGGMFQGEVVIESWDNGLEPDDPKYKSGKSNKFKSVLPLE